MTSYEDFCKEVSSRLNELAVLAKDSTYINPEYYEKYDVKLGLRDINGKGVLTGLTEISEIVATKPDENGVSRPARGELYYRGYNIRSIVDGFTSRGGKDGFEETAYLLLFGVLPTADELKDFKHILTGFSSLPVSFVRDILMKAPSPDMMNVLARSVLTLYSYDSDADDISIPNVLAQCMKLIAQFPMLAVYGYKVFHHYYNGGDLVIRQPKEEFSIAENILYMLRSDGKFSPLEAELLDMCLVLHMEHGGGNNSSFTTHVVSSSGTDTYSAIAASLGSLKGPRHGGANIKVVKMFEDIKENLTDYSDESVKEYLFKILNKEAFDKSGLIYGMGHAVYSLSDPRADILHEYVKKLAMEKGLTEEYALYEKIERLAPQVIMEKRAIYKGVSCNIDFYSGFVYSLLRIPPELFTPIFAIARVVGWSAHRIEELSNNGKIIRPGYNSVAERRDYKTMDERKSK